MDEELAELKARIAALEADVAAIKGVRVVGQYLTAQEMRQNLNAKAVRPGENKAVRLREDK